MKSLKLKSIQNKKRVIGYLVFVFDYEIKNYQNINKFIKAVVDSINHSKLMGYAGFQHQKHLAETLKDNLFDHYSKNSFTPLKKKIPRSKITNIIKKTLEKSNKYLTSRLPTRIFIFPTFSKFVRDAVSGVIGYAPWKYIFHIYFHPEAKNFEEELKMLTVHEYNHTIFFENHGMRKNILESIIMEGLAINFSLKVVVGKPPKFATALSQKQCRKIWPKVKKVLKSKSSKLNEQLFHDEHGKYPYRTGYSLGYQIVKSFLKKYPALSWQEIMKLKPKEILEESNWV